MDSMSVVVVRSSPLSLRFCRLVDEDEPKYSHLLEEIKNASDLPEPPFVPMPDASWYRPEIEAFLKKWDSLPFDKETRSRFVTEYASIKEVRILVSLLSFESHGSTLLILHSSMTITTSGRMLSGSVVQRNDGL